MRYRRSAYEDNPGMEMFQGVQAFGNAMRIGQQLEQGRMEREDEKGINAAYEHIAGKVGQSGDISILDGDPIMNTRHGTMAAGKFLGQRAQNETSRLQMLKAMSSGDDEFYRNTFRPLAFAADEAYKVGDMQRFGAIANELSAKSPMPYQVIPTQDGNFNVRFRSSAEGDWIDTGQRMTSQEVMDGIGNIIGGEQKVLAGSTMQTQTVNPRFLASAARYRMGTIQGNAQAMADPKQWIPMQKGGHLVYAIPQNRHDDYSALPSYRVLDERGGSSYLAGNMQELLDKGYVRTDVKAQSDKLMGRGGTDGYKLAQGDVSMLTKYATSENPETGEKGVDYGKVAFLQDFIQRTGRATPAAIAAYDNNVKAAMAKGASREQAERAAMVGMAQRINGGGRATSTPQANSASATNTAPAKADARIMAAAAGSPGIASGLNAGIAATTLPEGITPEQANVVFQNTPQGRQAYVTGKDGPIAISPEQVEAIKTGQQSPISQWWDNAPREQFKPVRRPSGKVTANEVLDELSPEEKSNWQKTGRLPDRYNQVH